MHIALLGEHHDLAPLLEIISGSDRHDMTALAEVGDALKKQFPDVPHLDSGERLLERGDFDVVLVSGAKERTLQSAKQLAGQGVPLIILPSASQGSAFLYELSLTRDDNGVGLFPLFPWRQHPLVSQLREWIHEGALGEVVQFEWTRYESTLTGLGKIDLEVCDQRMLADIDLLRQLSGNYNQITAIRTGAEDRSFAGQSVTLSGRTLPEALWTIRQGDEVRWELLVRGKETSAVLKSDEAGNIHALLRDGQPIQVSQEELCEAVCRELDDIEAALATPTHQNEWQEYIQVMETVEMTHQSVRRRRTIDLYFELTSERGQFKTQMTAIGCGIMMLTLFLLVVVLTLGQLFDLSPRAMYFSRILTFAPLFVFLFLQVLLFISRPSADES